MASMKPKWLRFVLLLWIILPVTILLVCVIKKVRTPRKYHEPPHIKLMMDAIATWERLAFIPVTNRDDLILQLRSVPITGDKLLNDIQREKLYPTILKLIDAFSQGSFQAFLEFRLPAHAHYVPNEKQVALIRTHCISNSASCKSTNIQDMYQWWVASRSGGDYYKDFWQGVCFDPKVIYRTIGTTNCWGLPAKAGIYVAEDVQWGGFGEQAVASAFNAGVEEYPPTFYFTDSPQVAGVGQKTGQVGVELYFFVRPQPPDPVLPIAVRYIWSSQATNWLPIDFVVGNGHMHSCREFTF